MSISYAASILPLFKPVDISHMGARHVYLNQIPFMTNAAGGGLGDAGPYADHGNARSVYSYLTGESQPQMPIGGAKWSKDNLALYNQWMTEGFNP